MQRLDKIENIMRNNYLRTIKFDKKETENDDDDRLLNIKHINNVELNKTEIDPLKHYYNLKSQLKKNTQILKK